MNIQDYLAFFHDGSFFNIEQHENEIVISMQTADMDKDDLKDDIPLSKFNRLIGKLHLKEIKKIKISNNLSLTDIKKKYDYGTILDFEIVNKNIDLGILWKNYPPKHPTNDFTIIEIEAEKIWWENIPDMKDPFE